MASPGFTPTNSVDVASFSSIFQSINSNYEQTLTGSRIPAIVTNTATRSSSRSIASTTPTTLVTRQSTRTSAATISSARTTNTLTSQSVSSSISALSNSSSISSSSPSSSTAQASGTSAANDSNASQSTNTSCHSVSCSSGLQAAIAVPICVVVVALVAILFFCMRRRKRRNRNDPVLQEKRKEKEEVKRKKRWSRYLGADNALLAANRRSSSNSTRDQGRGTVRSGNVRSGDVGSGQAGAHQSAQASVHSAEDAVPSYHDTVTGSHKLKMAEAGTGGIVAAGAEPHSHSIPKSMEPPPYGVAGVQSSDEHTNITDTTREPPSEVRTTPHTDGSPFIDPPNSSWGEMVGPALSRNSSVRQGVRPDDSSEIDGASDAGSIHEAQIGRNASVISRGKILQVRKSSGSDFQ